MELVHNGMRLSFPPTVYPPAEDSFMLAEAAETLRGAILEIGCGCGIASLSAAKASAANDVLGVDINPDAVSSAKSNAKENGITNARFEQGDLFSSIGRSKFDAIMFNPPYLPTSDEEHVSGPLNHAFDGGADGREVVVRFLKDFDDHIKPGGALLLVQSSLNGLDQTLADLRSKGYSCEAIKEEKFFFETISLLKASKP